MKKIFLSTITIAALALAGCSAAPASQSTATSSDSELSGELHIYAAASLKGAFGEIITAFEKEHPGIEVFPPVYDGSSTLVTQIVEGAPADIFASADEKNMEKLTDADLAAGTPEIFATNDITVAVAADNPQGITSLADLSNPEVTVVICAPEVPCGGATERLFTAEGITLTPVSLEQNVTAVATKVAEGEADAGLIYVTDVTASEGKLTAVTTPTSADLQNLYPISLVKEAANPAAATAFKDFVLSPAGQAIMKDYGFGSQN